MAVIAVVNRKGGSGKSTVAAHLAAWCARQAPGALQGFELARIVMCADAILMPVSPSLLTASRPRAAWTRSGSCRGSRPAAVRWPSSGCASKVWQDHPEGPRGAAELRFSASSSLPGRHARECALDHTFLSWTKEFVLSLEGRMHLPPI